MIRRLDVLRYDRIVVLTGAGVSAASGIRPYRGQGSEPREITSGQIDVETGRDNPKLIWSSLGPMRDVIQRAEPNAAHVALSVMEAHLCAGQTMTLITQNIDGLHQQAGSQNVVELHGSLSRTRCSNEVCSLAVFADEAIHSDQVPLCDLCQSPLLPDVVLFNEAIPVDAEWACRQAIMDCDLFIAVGTSGTVSPASNFVRSADYAGARTLLVNLEPLVVKNPYFHEEIIGPAEHILPALLAV